MVVHYMDPHLPYREPPSYRGRFDGGPEPERLSSNDGVYSREDVLRAVQGAGSEEVEDLARHLLARYDANVRYVDDEIARLLAVLSPQDVVVPAGHRWHVPRVENSPGSHAVHPHEGRLPVPGGQGRQLSTPTELAGALVPSGHAAQRVCAASK